MYRYLRLIALLLLLSSAVSAASIRSQVSLLEASENIKLKSQKITVHYLTYYGNPDKYLYAKKRAITALKDLDREFELIDRSTKESEADQILAQLKQSRNEMVTLFGKEMNEKQLKQMLEKSDTMLDGADKVHQLLDFSLLSMDAKMVIDLKKVSFLIEKITRLYLTYHIQPSITFHKERLTRTIWEMQEAIDVLNDYNFNRKNFAIMNQLTKNWTTLESYYTKKPEIKMENIVLLASREVQRFAILLEKNHSKEQ